MKKIILYTLLALLLGTSCAKRTESKLVGTWRIETEIGSENMWLEGAYWKFYSDGTLEVLDIYQRDSLPDKGTYDVFTRSLVTPYIKIKGLGDLTLNGIWRVEKCNNKHLVINRVEWLNGDTQAAFMRREFRK